LARSKTIDVSEIFDRNQLNGLGLRHLQWCEVRKPTSIRGRLRFLD